VITVTATVRAVQDALTNVVSVADSRRLFHGIRGGCGQMSLQLLAILPVLDLIGGLCITSSLDQWHRQQAQHQLCAFGSSERGLDRRRQTRNSKENAAEGSSAPQASKTQVQADTRTEPEAARKVPDINFVDQFGNNGLANLGEIRSHH
jgi:hypothetical protein